MKLNATEGAAIHSFRENEEIPLSAAPTDENILRVSLFLALQIGKMLRGARNRPDALKISTKKDGSIVTQMDCMVEEFARESLQAAFPAFNFVGEETGGGLIENGFNAAVDPIGRVVEFYLS